MSMSISEIKINEGRRALVLERIEKLKDSTMRLTDSDASDMGGI